MKLINLIIIIVLGIVLNYCGSSSEKTKTSKKEKPKWIENNKVGVYITDNKRTMYFVGRAEGYNTKMEARKKAIQDAYTQYAAFLKSTVESTITKSSENINVETGKSIESTTINKFSSKICKKISADTSEAVISDEYSQKEIKEDGTIKYNYYVRIATSACEIKHKITKTVTQDEDSTESIDILKDDIQKQILSNDVDKIAKKDTKIEEIKQSDNVIEEELEEKKAKGKINPYSYWITAITPGLNHLYLPYILNPIDDDEYKDGVGGSFFGGLVGGLVGGTASAVGSGLGGRASVVFLVGGLVGGFVGGGIIIGIESSEKRMFVGIGGASTGFRAAWYFNYLYRISNDGNSIYMGELLGIAVGGGVGYGLGNIYDNPWSGAIAGASVGFLTGLVTDLLTKDDLIEDYDSSQGSDEGVNKYYNDDGIEFDLEKYKKDVVLGILITEGIIYVANLIGYIIVYNCYNPEDSDKPDGDISFAGIDFQPIIYQRQGVTLIDKGATGKIYFRF